MRYLDVKIKKVLRLAFISAVFCIPNITFISEIDISKPISSKSILGISVQYVLLFRAAHNLLSWTSG